MKTIATSSIQNTLANEQVTFIQHQLPGFDDGEYQITVSQNVNDSDGNPISDDSLNNAYTFGVVGDRFALSNPSAQVDSVFPPDDGTGKFTTVLPHVVFTQTTFPWSRYPTNQKPAPTGDQDAPTWLTILVLDEDDAAAFPVLLKPADAIVGDLFPKSLYQDSTLLDGNFSYFFNATSTKQLALDLSQDIQVIDVPLDLFWQIAPTLADLNLMAHIRQVSLMNKATPAGGIPGKRPKLNDDGVPVGTYSIVFGNRLPQTEKKAYAYLVSLEGLQDFLPVNEQGGPPANASPPGTAFLRLAVLMSWKFFSTGESATFVEQLKALNGGSTADSNLILPYAGNNAQVRDALQMGFVPLNHNLRTGGRTVSWYRGPLVPYQISEQRVAVPIESPDKATIFDPTMGMFDESYAAAWTLGRMLALQDTGFSSALYQWKRGLAQDVIKAVEDELLGEAFGAVLNQGPTPKALQGVDPRRSSRALLHKTIQALAPRE